MVVPPSPWISTTAGPDPVLLDEQPVRAGGDEAIGVGRVGDDVAQQPEPVAVTVTSSPGCRYFGGSNPIPTPTGVPVAITSPGSNVIPAVRVSMMVGTSKISSAVLVSWRSSPLTLVCSCRLVMSTSSAVTAHGPIGQNVSRPCR